MSVELQVIDETAAGNTVFVYEGPVRLWHWLNALSIFVLAITGYLIAYVFAVAFLARVYWALVGNHHAKQLFILPVTDMEWWGGMVQELLWYMFLVKQPRKYVGHNPLAHLCMFFGITVGGIFMITTGFALYGEGAQEGHWAHTVFTSWVIPLFGQSQDVHTWHHMFAWAIVWFIIVHVYAALREDIMSRQTMVSAIVSGSRTFRD